MHPTTFISLNEQACFQTVCFPLPNLLDASLCYGGGLRDTLPLVVAMHHPAMALHLRAEHNEESTNYDSGNSGDSGIMIRAIRVLSELVGVCQPHRPHTRATDEDTWRTYLTHALKAHMQSKIPSIAWAGLSNTESIYYRTSPGNGRIKPMVDTAISASFLSHTCSHHTCSAQDCSELEVQCTVEQ